MIVRELQTTPVVTGAELVAADLVESHHIRNDTPSFFPDIRTIRKVHASDMGMSNLLTFSQLPETVWDACTRLAEEMKSDVKRHHRYRERGVVIYPDVIYRCQLEYLTVRDAVRNITGKDYGLFRGIVNAPGKLASTHLKPTVKMLGLHTDMSETTLEANYTALPDFRRVVINLTPTMRRVSVIPKSYREIVTSLNAGFNDDWKHVVTQYLSRNPECQIVTQYGFEFYEIAPFEVVHDGFLYGRTEADCVLILDYHS